MKFRPDFNHYRESPWILLTLPDTRRTENASDGTMNKEVRRNRLPFGIQHTVTKNNALNSATWPRSNIKISKTRVAFADDDDRPKTATLDHPKILDIAFLGKIDMTNLSRKSLMSIANLCILPIKQDSKRSGGALLGDRGAKTRRFGPHRSPSPRIRKPIRFVSTDKETNSETESVRSAGKFPIPPKPLPMKPSILKVKSQSSVASEKSQDSNSDKESKRKSVITKRLKNAVDVFGGVINVTEPCTTCGRSDQPERLHSHPVPPCSVLKTLVVDSPRVEVKSSVRKPVPIRYRSEKARKQEEVIAKTTEPVKHGKEEGTMLQKPTERKKDAPGSGRPANSEKARKSEEGTSVARPVTNTIDPEKNARIEIPAVRRKGDRPTLVLTPDPYTASRRDVSRTPEPGKTKAMRSPDPDALTNTKGGGRQGPKTTVCYICGRGFGSTSIRLHEPQCMQRRLRENALLAPHLQRTPPQKPDMAVTSGDWNRSAYKASQSQLVSCDNCGRTFNPDRLEVHQRSCRAQSKTFGGSTNLVKPGEQSGSDTDSGGMARNTGPPAVYCYICGRMFGTKSIAIHEPKCLDKWHHENNDLPAHQRRPEPMRPGQSKVSTSPAPTPPPATAPLPAQPMGSAKKRSMVPCYLCGRGFGTVSINIHEPQCLKKWRFENSKLPVAKRRPEPEKPDVVYNTETGQIDFQLTMDAIWETHLGQLVPCKHCGRTFSPDRVDVHERSCKGTSH